MKKLILYIFCLMFPVLVTSQIEDPTSWSFDVEDLGQGTYNLLANVEIDEGWHIYSQYKNPESFIVSTSFYFKSIDGFKVCFLTGTDEHGLKIQRSAEKNNKDPKVFCDEISKTFKDLTKILNLSNTDFIRTTEKRHINSVKEIWKTLEKNKNIYLSKYSGWYSISDEAFSWK